MNNGTRKPATIKEVARYVPGTNEYLDKIIGDEVVWICQGNKGRRPVIANTEAEARARYLEIDAPAFKTEEEFK